MSYNLLGLKKLLEQINLSMEDGQIIEITRVKMCWSMNKDSCVLELFEYFIIISFVNH